MWLVLAGRDRPQTHPGSQSSWAQAGHLRFWWGQPKWESMILGWVKLGGPAIKAVGLEERGAFMHSNCLAKVLLCVRSGEGCGEYNGAPR